MKDFSVNKGLYTNPGGQQQCEYTGRVYQSHEYGPYTVLRELIGIGMKSRIFEVEFHNTGYHAIVTRGKMISGEIKDKYVPSVYGIGYLGDEYYITDPNKRMYYKVWSGMLARCYNPNHQDYKTYGAVGVTVDPRWHNFTTFYFDIRNIPGFYNKVTNPRMYKLDKDYLQQHLPHNERVYSKETCIWVSEFENLILRSKDNNNVGYFGVTTENDGISYSCYIHSIFFGRFKDATYTAILFNYLYPIFRNSYCTLPMINNVPMVPFEELINKSASKDRLLSIYNQYGQFIDLMYNNYLNGLPLY